MFIIGIFGGIASQINQYAFSLELKRRYPNTKIKYAIAADWMKEGQHNGYELDRVFGLKLEKAGIKEIKRLANFYPGNGLSAVIGNRILGIRKRILGKKDTQITFEDPTVFVPEIFKVNSSKDILFWGNWIADDYYKESESRIKNDLSFKIKLTDENQKIASQIELSNSVSVHVRHGDYLHYGFNILNDDYYRRAVDYIREKVDNPQFFIFSDDKEFITKELSFIDNAVIVSNNYGKDSYIDMQLMSMCKHNIIANSGFSFWGAWLNSNSDKIVVAPSKHVDWCKNPLALKEWKKINV